MLIIARKMNQINLRQVAAVYAQSFERDGGRAYPHLSAEEQVAAAWQDFLEYLYRFFQIPGSVYYLWSVEGRYVTALRSELYSDGVLLTGLETAPGERRSGYARTLLLAALEKEGSMPVYSHVSKQNQASFRLHRSCGFQIQKDCARLLDGTVTSRYWTLVYRKQ